MLFSLGCWQGLEDLGAFARGTRPVLWWERRLFGSSTSPQPFSTRFDWSVALEDCKKEKKVLVFLAVHGGAHGEGAYLVIASLLAALEAGLAVLQVIWP